MDDDMHISIAPMEEEDLADMALHSDTDKSNTKDKNSNTSNKSSNTNKQVAKKSSEGSFITPGSLRTRTGVYTNNSSEKLILSEAMPTDSTNNTNYSKLDPEAPSSPEELSKPIDIANSSSYINQAFVSDDNSGSASSVSFTTVNGHTNNGSTKSNNPLKSTVQTTSNLSLHNSFLKSLPADPETTITESEPSTLRISIPNTEGELATESTANIPDDARKTLQPSFSLNENLKELEKKAKEKERSLAKKTSIQELRKTKSKIDAKSDINSEATNAAEAEQITVSPSTGEAPSRNSGFFTTVWSTATNSLRTPKANTQEPTFSENSAEDLGLNVKKSRAETLEDPLNNADGTTKIILYRKSSRKISIPESNNRLRSTSGVSYEGSEAGSSVVSSPQQTSVDTKANPLDEKSPSFNANIYLEDLVYDTKYHYAIDSRNSDFHILFKSVLPEERLIDDFSCALSREILLQGRLYISDRNLCFNANILGWVTNLVVSFGDITSFEKTTTAALFPNGIAVTTKSGAKHNFATFLSRDSTYEFLNTIWLNYIQKYGENPKEDNGVVVESPIQSTASTPAISDTGFVSPVDGKPARNNVTMSVPSASTSRFGPNGHENEAYFDYARNMRIKNNHDIFLRGILPPLRNQSRNFLDTKTSENDESDVASTDLRSFEEEFLSIDDDEEEKSEDGEEDEEDEEEDEEDEEDEEEDGTEEEAEQEEIDTTNTQIDKENVKEPVEVAPTTPARLRSNSPVESHVETDYLFSPEDNKEKILINDEIIDATLPQVFGLMYGKNPEFQKKYIASLSGLDISPIENFKQLTEGDLPNDPNFAGHIEPGKKQRMYFYTKALNYLMGPKSTVVRIIETIEEQNFDRGVNIIVKSLTPDVPSGKAFTVQTRYLLAWGTDNKTKLKVSYWMDWTGRSWVRKIIESSTDSGQKEAAQGLINLLKSEIVAYVANGDESGDLMLSKARRSTIKKKRVTGLGSPAVFQTDFNQEKTKEKQKTDHSSFLHLEVGNLNEEIEEMEKTLWDIIYHNWLTLIVLTSVLIIMYLQIKIYNAVLETNLIEKEQLAILKQSASKRSFFKGPTNDYVYQKQNKVVPSDLKVDTEQKLWDWLTEKAHLSGHHQNSNDGDRKTDASSNSQPEEINDERIKEMKQELNTLFMQLLSDTSSSESGRSDNDSAKSRKYHVMQFTDKLTRYLAGERPAANSQDTSMNIKDYFLGSAQADNQWGHDTFLGVLNGLL